MVLPTFSAYCNQRETKIELIILLALVTNLVYICFVSLHICFGQSL